MLKEEGLLHLGRLGATPLHSDLVGDRSEEIRLWSLADIDRNAGKSAVVRSTIGFLRDQLGDFVVVRNSAWNNSLLADELASLRVRHLYHLWGNKGQSGSVEESLIAFHSGVCEAHWWRILTNYWHGAGNGFVLIYGDGQELMGALTNRLGDELWSYWPDDLLSSLATAHVPISAAVIQSEEADTLSFVVDPQTSTELASEISLLCGSYGLEVAAEQLG